MIELIVAIIFFISLIGMGVILFRKIPVLAQLPPKEVARPEIFQRLRQKIKKTGSSGAFSSEMLLQKILSKIRILTLKTENKTGHWLGKLRRKSLEKKKKISSDDYWQKIKKGE